MRLLPELPPNFHAGRIDSARVGPRRELTLTLTGWFPIAGSQWRRYQNETWPVRFGGIENLATVRTFCAPAILGQRIGNRHYAADEAAHAHRLLFVLSMYDEDAVLRIHCRNLTASRVTTEVSP